MLTPKICHNVAKSWNINKEVYKLCLYKFLINNIILFVLSEYFPQNYLNTFVAKSKCDIFNTKYMIFETYIN